MQWRSLISTAKWLSWDTRSFVNGHSEWCFQPSSTLLSSFLYKGAPYGCKGKWTDGS